MTQTTAHPATVTFTLDGDSDEALTSVVLAGDTERRGLGALDSLASYLYDDLRALARAHPDALAEALRAPEDAAEDANLLLKLVCADLEQLLREQHIRAVALVVAAPDVSDVANPERRAVNYRALYRVERSLNFDDDAEDGTPPPLVRRASRRSVAAYLSDGAEVALLLDWTPQAVKRGPMLRRPPYQFLWVRTAAAQFEDERLPIGQPGPSGTTTGTTTGTPGGAGGWHVAAVGSLTS